MCVNLLQALSPTPDELISGDAGAGRPSSTEEPPPLR
jgi:hypothetical protein